MRLCAGQDLQSWLRCELQDLKIADGRTIYEAMGELNESTPLTLEGQYGFTMAGCRHRSQLYPEQIQDLRARLPSYVLPGTSAIEPVVGTADVMYAFNEKGHWPRQPSRSNT